MRNLRPTVCCALGLTLASLSPGSQMSSVPVSASWDTLGIYPLTLGRHLSRDDTTLIRSLDRGETEKAMERSLARLRTSKDDIVAGWVYSQAARIRSRGSKSCVELDAAMDRLEYDKSHGGLGTDYARLKCAMTKALTYTPMPDDAFFVIDTLFFEARITGLEIAKAHPDSPEFLPLLVDALSPREAREALSRFCVSHPSNQMARLWMADALSRGNRVRIKPQKNQTLAVYDPESPLLEESVAMLQNLRLPRQSSAGVQFKLGCCYAKQKNLDAAIPVFTALSKNPGVPAPIAEFSKRFLLAPKFESLVPSPDE